MENMIYPSVCKNQSIELNSNRMIELNKKISGIGKYTQFKSFDYQVNSILEPFIRKEQTMILKLYDAIYEWMVKRVQGKVWGSTSTSGRNYSENTQTEGPDVTCM